MSGLADSTAKWESIEQRAFSANGLAGAYKAIQVAKEVLAAHHLGRDLEGYYPNVAILAMADLIKEQTGQPSGVVLEGCCGLDLYWLGKT